MLIRVDRELPRLVFPYEKYEIAKTYAYFNEKLQRVRHEI